MNSKNRCTYQLDNCGKFSGTEVRVEEVQRVLAYGMSGEIVSGQISSKWNANSSLTRTISFCDYDNSVIRNSIRKGTILLSLSPSTATCERGLPSMNKFNTDMKTRMGQKTLDSLLQISHMQSSAVDFCPGPAIDTRLNNGYQYLERDKLPTMHFQKSLPRLPIPELEKTCDRYLKSQKPILNEEKFNKTTSIVKKFQDGIGKDLNKDLIEQDKKNKHTSYITGPWFDMYLTARESNVLNFNPYIGFAPDPKPEYRDQLIRSTNMLVSSLRLYKSLKENVLSPQVFHLNPAKSDTKLFKNFNRFLPSSLSWYGAYLFKAFPLDMSQFKNLFNSTKVPGVGKDILRVNPNAKHMLVIRNGNYYIFDVLDEDDNIHSPQHILACLKHVKDDKRPPSKNSIGIMTAENRDKWALTRKHMIQIGNETQFDLIDTALFAMVLEDEDFSHDNIYLAHQMLHGNADNRWFDKSFQLIIDQSGTASVNFEHSWGDGVAILRYFEEVFKDSTQNHHVHPDTKPESVNTSQLVKVIEFNLDDKSRAAISEAHSSYKNLIEPLGLTAFRYEGLGKDLIKSKKLSPDSVIQLAFQMAFHMQNGFYPATYESCSTSAFKHGRTETMRPCTMATKQFIDSVSSNNRPSNQDLIAMLVNCSKVHSQLVKEAAMGQGFDRHLYALKILSQQKLDELPEMFQDSSYKYINANVLSTSTLSSDALQGAAFAPVVPDGFGLGYMLWKDGCGSAISYYKGQRDADGFRDALSASFDCLRSNYGHHLCIVYIVIVSITILKLCMLIQFLQNEENRIIWRLGYTVRTENLAGLHSIVTFVIDNLHTPFVTLSVIFSDFEPI
ncbi:Carnitine O-palmitoyltransferase 2, mitochondrial [Nymphon striatum]|nr:Carnitine O-palmitoyltransferase 2, mitochondrial [Nymphon striatum]